jgi:hypothetical protein
MVMLLQGVERDSPTLGGWLILMAKQPFFRFTVIHRPSISVSHVENVKTQSLQTVGSSLNLQQCIILEPDA